MSTPTRIAPSNVVLTATIPVILALVQFAPDRLALVRIAPERVEFRRSAPVSVALVKSAFDRIALRKLAPVRSAFQKSDPDNSALEKSMPARFWPLKSVFSLFELAKEGIASEGVPDSAA